MNYKRLTTNNKMSKTFTFLLKRSTLQLLFIMSVLPTSLLLHFGAIIKKKKNKNTKNRFLEYKY